METDEGARNGIRWLDSLELNLPKVGKETHDDLIHLFELKNQEIITDLVVLSTCNTGN